MASDFIIDGFGPLDAGCNSGVPPQLLPANQTAFSTNCTHRGGYARNRPAYRKMNWKVTGDSPKKLLFQGSAYYKPNTGPESIRAQLGGRLFQFQPSTGSDVAITEWTIPGDPNPVDKSVAWMWQSENWMIVQNGENKPIFWWEGGARRSLGESRNVGSVIVGFVTPGKNGTVDTNTSFTGALYDQFYIDGILFEAVPGTPSALPWNANIINITDTVGAGGAHPIGTAIVSNPNITVNTVAATFAALNLTNAQQTSVNNFIADPSIANEAAMQQVPNGLMMFRTLRVATVPNVARGSLMTILGESYVVVAVTTASQVFPTAATLTLVTAQSVVGGALPVNTQITIPGSSAPIVTLGTLTRAMTFAPAVGGNETILMSVAYTGVDNAYVFVGGALYKITQSSGPAIDPTQLRLLQLGDGTGVVVNPGDALLTPAELPAGRMGAYGMGRNWVSLTDGHSFMAGDIVGGSSGTTTFSFRDSVLKSTENTFLDGGGNFIVPGSGATIQAMQFSATLDVSLGQGPLQVFTANSVFSCMTPVDRFVWSTITNPILTQSLIGNGGVGQYSTVLANGDILFRSIDGIRSLILARRDFDTWGNVPISREMQRVIDVDSTATDLLPFSSAILFDNRLLMTCLPNTGPLGVYHQGLMALNFDPVSSLRGKSASIYDGLWTGLNVLQLVTGLFSGVQRAFAFCYNTADDEIQLWELLPTSDLNNFDNGTTPITWGFESAAMFKSVKGKGAFDIVELLDAEIYISELKGPLEIVAYYRAENDPCWHYWNTVTVCAGSDGQYRSRLGLGVPSVTDCDQTNNRPARYGVNFQVAFQLTGSCRFMGGLCKARQVPETQFSVPKCDPLETTPCLVPDVCLDFPPGNVRAIFYNLNDHPTFENIALTFVVDGNVITVPPGVVTYNPPYTYPPDGHPPPPTVPPTLPPLVINCPCGGTVVKNIPQGFTFSDIANLINAALSECAGACNGGPPLPPAGRALNTEQTASSTCPDGTQFTYIVRAGTYSATTQAEADALALNAAIIGANIYKICLGPMSPLEICQGDSAICSADILSGSGPFQAFLIGGQVPTGMTVTLSGTSVEIGGVPTITGTFTFTIRIVDKYGNTKDNTYSIAVNGILPDILPDGQLTIAYSEAVFVDGPALGPFTWSIVDGALPDGLTLDPLTGAITGIPTLGGVFDFTVGVTNE